MASPASRSASALPENQGHQRANGTERTSTTAVTPASLSKATKRSAARLEWPICELLTRRQQRHHDRKPGYAGKATHGILQPALGHQSSCVGRKMYHKG